MLCVVVVLGLLCLLCFIQQLYKPLQVIGGTLLLFGVILNPDFKRFPMTTVTPFCISELHRDKWACTYIEFYSLSELSAFFLLQATRTFMQFFVLCLKHFLAITRTLKPLTLTFF